MANLQSTTISDTGYLRLPAGANADRPANTGITAAGVGINGTRSGSIRINSTTGAMEFFDGTSWTLAAISWPHRTIITTHFVVGGYKDSVAWKNVNKCYGATDTTISLGDVSERAFNYQFGACSKIYAYTFGAGDGHAVSSNYTIAFNMKTESSASDISRTLNNSRSTFGGVFQEDRFAFWSGGGSSAIEEYNMYTKTFVGTITPTYSTGNNWGMSAETYGIFYGTGQNTFTFATRTLASRSGNEPGAHHQQKSVNSKFMYGYAGNQGTYNGGNYYRRTNYTTNTSTATDDCAKPYTNCGEENYTLGQDWQYMLGNYDGGGQNNGSHKFVYATETGVSGSASLNTKGVTAGGTTINGRSSGVGAWSE